MSIKKSLQSSILLIAVIPVILMAILAYVAATTKYANINKENTTRIAKDYSNGMISQLESQIIETESLASTNDIKSYLLEKVNAPDVLLDGTSSSYNNIKESITQISNNFDQNVNYYIYDVDGYLVISSCKDSISDWSEIMTETVDSYTETTILSDSNFTKDTLDIITPVIVKNQVIGLVRTNISSEYFGIFLSKEKGSFLVDQTGQCLFDYKISSTDDQVFLNQLNEIFANSGNNNSLREINDAFSGSDNYIYGYASIPEYNWIYVVKQDTSSYTSIVSTLPVVFIILLIIVIIFSIIISNNLAIKYTQPILELSSNMKSAAEGQLEVHCSVDSEDEFGQLSNNFNQMMEIISTNYNEISDARKKLEDNQEELKNNYQRIEKLAYTDALTGLHNRMAFFKFSNKILSDNQGGFKKHAVIFIDLDGFKAINDTLGHDYGDLLLQAVANQFSALVDEDDILARNGGDEFVILRNHVESTENLETFLNSLVSIASHPFMLDDETVHVTISAGVALFPQNGLSLSELMKNADIAMYTSKSSGKNSYTFFNSTMEDEVNRRNDLIDILRDAIDNHDIYLLYQPQADISTGEIIGCEALMRLNSPIVGFVSPDEFIPVAEECGLIDELGEWALLEACNFNQRLMDAGFKPLQISVNVSTAQLRGDRLLKIIEELPNKTAMPLKYLELELTESVLMKNFDHNLTLINRIKELGIHIALDDFGTGYSSFSYLTKIPINTLKIDKSFIAGICDNENDTYIAGTIINLAHQLGITVIAEGVETIEQLRILQGQMCDILQGYFFSRAISEKDFIELLKINS
ncbi:MAG: EAL domain-containing protein [Lachnospiraceae bacterium]